MPETPETETIELRQDTVEQLIELLHKPGDFNNHEPPMMYDRRMVVADRLKRQISSPDAVALCGLPAAGKGYTAEKLSTVYDAPVISMGDAIRLEYKEQNWLGAMESEVPDEIPSDELGDFAAEWRDEAPAEIPRKVTEMVDEVDSELVIIDGVRSVTDYEVLSDYFDDFYLMEVTARFMTRLQRIKDRGREGEEDFNRVDLAERDINELENLGFEELTAKHTPDLFLQNDRQDNFTINLSNLVENQLPFDIEDGWPLGLNSKLESMRQAQQENNG